MLDQSRIHWVAVALTTAVVGLVFSPFVVRSHAEPAGQQPQAKAAAEATDEQLGPPEDPAVAAVLATNPLTPRERVRAALVLMKLRRPDLAKQMLTRVLASPLDPLTLNALHEEFGSAAFFQLASQPELAPEGSQLAQLVFDAVRAVRIDPQRLEGLVEKLCQEKGENWVGAAEALIQAGPAALAPLMTVLLDPSRAAAWPRVETVLLWLRPDTDEALLSLLLSVPDDKKLGIIHALTALQIKSAGPFLLATTLCGTCPVELQTAARTSVKLLIGDPPTSRGAIRLMVREIDSILKAPVMQGREVVHLLRWDSSSDKIVLQRLSFELWRRERAAYLAQAAFRAARDDSQLRDLAAVAVLEKLGYIYREEWHAEKSAEAAEEAPGDGVGGAQEELVLVHAEVAKALAELEPTVEDVSRWLAQCLDNNWNGGAWAAIAWLAGKGSPAALASGGIPPLVRAVQAPDRSLGFAALEAVLRLAPGGSFPRSSYVWQELLYFARSRGVREALVATTNPQEGAQLAAYLKSAGFDRVEVVPDGTLLLRKVSQMPDCEVMLVSAAIQNPRLDLTLQRLRADPRGARIPVLIYGESEWLPRADHVAQWVPLSLSVAKPQSSADLASLIQRLATLPGADRTSPAERMKHAEFALRWLLVLCQNPPTGLSLQDLEEVATAALQVRGQETLAIEILAKLATPVAQTQLVEAASRENWPLELRVKALGGFREAVEKRGVQLTSQQILRQYERYNQSADQDPASQRILGLILDCIETPFRSRQTRVSSNP